MQNMQQNPDYLRQAQIFVFVQWVFFNALGWGVGVLSLIAVREASSANVIYGLMAFMLGLGQWYALRPYLNRPKFAWPLLTTLGFVLGQLAAQSLTDWLRPNLANVGAGVVFGGIIGILLGLVLSLIQLPLLPRDRAPVVDWVVANMIGWGLGLQLSALVPLNFQVTSLIAAILNACITGLWVMQLLNDE